MKIFHKTLIGLASIATLGSCTAGFEEMNTNPNLIGENDASAKYFLTELMIRPYIPARYAYWRANLIHTDRYAGHFTFGQNGNWWSDELGYSYNVAYTDAAWDHYNGLLGTVKQLLEFTEPGGAFENELTHAVVLILKSHYFQLYTDTFGMIPYSEVFSDEDISLPKFDSQKDIYKGIIADLDAAMAAIGDNTSTGNALEDLGDNDVIYGGDLQKWKRFANTLKLKMAMRAQGAEGDDFSQSAINEALAAPLLSEGESALIEKDLEISQWDYSTYADVWHNFGAGSDWAVGRELVDYLRDNNDPRLDQYVKPAAGGEFTLIRPTASEDQEGYDLFPKRTNFLKTLFDESGAEYTWDDQGSQIVVSMPENTNYIGQPVRLSGEMSSLLQFGFFCSPSDLVIQQKNQGGASTPETVLLSGESYLLQAEAVLKGLSSGDAQDLYQMGIKEAMRVWGVDDASIDAFLATEAIAQLDGTTDENLEKVYIQRWIAHYTDGYEAWAIVRDSGYPATLAAGVSDYELYGPGTITAGGYPQRLRYGSSLQASNPNNYNDAISNQGPDMQGTKLWWAK
ncbi:SusD/RagB family nutrient-binding outer membrane lipoprotein [Echinicola sp. 20G]|uniref:SusD/RagB family nutrient-binding outer membrane lipoprotein n=1 Tax=Echinicola sp. 20G TaxID=2781961 RepID=UPI0019107203|nr:SusD/RagB family nutrient-binding outer membrane lipoprotein [Echinicola sp. 20G]